MKIYKTQEEIEADIVDGVLSVDEDVTFECNFKIEASLQIRGNIDARDIDAWDIDAGNINAGNITFYALCFARESFTCKSILGRRKNAKYGCLDSEVVITG